MSSHWLTCAFYVIFTQQKNLRNIKATKGSHATRALSKPPIRLAVRFGLLIRTLHVAREIDGNALWRHECRDKYKVSTGSWKPRQNQKAFKLALNHQWTLRKHDLICLSHLLTNVDDTRQGRRWQLRRSLRDSTQCGWCRCLLYDFLPKPLDTTSFPHCSVAKVLWLVLQEVMQVGT